MKDSLARASPDALLVGDDGAEEVWLDRLTTRCCYQLMKAIQVADVVLDFFGAPFVRSLKVRNHKWVVRVHEFAEVRALQDCALTADPTFNGYHERTAPFD